MPEMIENHVGHTQVEDAFVAFGLVSASTKTWNENIACRLRILYSFLSNLERFAFLSDLRTSNPVLLDALFQKDDRMVEVYSEVQEYLRMMADEQPFLPTSIGSDDQSYALR